MCGYDSGNGLGLENRSRSRRWIENARDREMLVLSKEMNKLEQSPLLNVQVKLASNCNCS